VKGSLNRVFVVFEVILSIAIANILLVFGSFISLFVLFPVLLVSTIYYLRNMYIHRDFTGIIYSYIMFLKGNIIKTFKMLYLFVLFIGLLILSIVYYNQILFELAPDLVIVVIYLVQAFMLYQTVGVMLVSSILYTQNPKTPNMELINKAFLLFNAHPIKGLVSTISLVVGMIFVVRILPFSYMLVFPLGLFFFYVVFSDVIEGKNYV